MVISWPGKGSGRGTSVGAGNETTQSPAPRRSWPACPVVRPTVAEPRNWAGPARTSPRQGSPGPAGPGCRRRSAWGGLLRRGRRATARLDLEAWRKLREIGATAVLESPEARIGAFMLGRGSEDRVKIDGDEAHSSFTHAKDRARTRRVGRTFPDADFRRLVMVADRGLDQHVIAYLGACWFIVRHQNVVLQCFTGFGGCYRGCALAKQVCACRIRPHYIWVPDPAEV